VSWGSAGRWILWFAVVALVTAVLVPIRSEADQSYIPLVFLLIVLGGSIGAGLRLGFTLATVSFVVMDFFLQPPFGRVFNFGRPTDFTTLAAFYAVAGVASRLLESARRERDLARQRADEIAALSHERERLIAEAEHAEALRETERFRDFVLTSVSHDLRTPLTTIKALAQEEQRTGESRGAEIEQQADTLSRMVGDLLDLSRLRSGAFGVTPELNAAEDVIGAAIRRCEGILDGRRVEAVIDPDAPPLFGTFDFLSTLRILGNLIENALQVTPRGGRVEVTPRREGAMVVIEVADRGPGVPTAERDRIFEPFYRPQGSPPDRGRAGLGLAIAQALAHAQGGAVGHRDRTGGGSVFEVALPAADAPLPEGAPLPEEG
jgi:two-component system sensor histidine kinase KdpD